ncbi:hypothetical protein SAMN05518849_10215 [Sphingobium sp. AP50]|nr:hypothetical protein SAMN05518849_10215 [Sphingobium sp. AP50]
MLGDLTDFAQILIDSAPTDPAATKKETDGS